MPANSPFASSHHLNASSFKLNNILPPDTHLTGKLAVVWSIPAASTTPCLRLAIECSLPTSLGGDYVPFAETARSTTTYRVKLMLLPSDANLKDWTDVVAKIQAEQTELQKCLSYEFTISTDGMQVTEVEGDKVGMEGKGERRLECKNRVMTVFAGKRTLAVYIGRSRTHVTETDTRYETAVRNALMVHIASAFCFFSNPSSDHPPTGRAFRQGRERHTNETPF